MYKRQVYDLTRAVKDGATVPVYFEPRLIRVALDDGVTPEDLDAAANEITLGLDDVERARIERSVANLNRLYGAPDRIEALVDDLLAHWDARAEAMTGFIGSRGKAMIVCVTREVCVRVYEAIVRRRPDWANASYEKGRVKVVFSGVPSDPAAYQPHIRRPSQEKAVKERAANAQDELELIIVKDMLLTGFDSPSLHTLYLDRPMRDALLMQTLARVNRTFRGKRDGLLVAYAPVSYTHLDVYKRQGLPILNQKCIRNGRVNRMLARSGDPSRIRKDTVLTRGDVLINSTGTGTLGRVGRWTEDLPASLDSHVTLVRPAPHEGVNHVGYALLALEGVFESLAEGSTGQTELSRASVAQTEIRMPSIVKPSLEELLDSLTRFADAATAQASMLTTLRDQLLPKLMSGELRVEDAEKQVEEVV